MIFALYCCCCWILWLNRHLLNFLFFLCSPGPYTHMKTRVMIWSCLHREVGYISTYLLCKYRRSNNNRPESSHALAITLSAVTDDIHLHCWCTMIMPVNATLRLYPDTEAKRIKCDINTVGVVLGQTSLLICSLSK